jgi:hypothetical protein
MDERQFQQVIELLKENKKSLRIIQYMVGFTLGFILAIYIIRIF